MLEAPIASANVVYTEDYDLDATMLFAGTVLNRVVSAHSNRDQRNAHLSAVGRTPSALVIELAGTVGLLRFASERDRLGLNCGGFPLHQTLDTSHAGIDVRQLSLIAVRRSPHATVVEATVATIVQGEKQQATDLRKYCNGHDTAAALSALVKRWGGSASRTVIEQATRSAFSCDDLKSTRFYRDVLAWCAAVGTTPIWSCM